MGRNRKNSWSLSAIILVFMTFSYDILIFKISLTEFYSRSLAIRDTLEYIIKP